LLDGFALPRYDFLLIIGKLCSYLEHFLDRYDSDTQCCPSLLRTYENLIKFFSEGLSPSRHIENNVRRAFLNAVFEQLFGFSVTETGEKKSSHVPTRIRDHDLAVELLSYDRQFQDLELAASHLASIHDRQCSALYDLIAEKTADWPARTECFLSKFDEVPQLSQDQFPIDSQCSTESSSQEAAKIAGLNPKFGRRAYEQMKTLTMKDEIELYRKIDPNIWLDCMFELLVKYYDSRILDKQRFAASNLDSNLIYWKFWDERSESYPLLSKVAKNLIIGSVGSTSQLERCFARTSCLKRKQRQSLSYKSCLSHLRSRTSKKLKAFLESY